jgi:pilus assembly protein CpaB
MGHKRRLLLIGALALALGGLSSFQVHKRLRAGLAPSRTDVDVIIAANDIQVGAKIANHDLKIAQYPPRDLPAHVFHTRTPVVGRGAVLPIRKGEFLVADKLADENGGAGLSALIATGMRAVAVRVNDVTSVNGFTVPGTRVDVLVVGNVTGSRESSAVTLLQDVAVLASGQKIERSSAGEPQSATVVTLLVPLEDAEKLALASQEAHIQLVLRNPLDTNKAKTERVESTTLLGGGLSNRPLRVMRTKHAPAEHPEAPTLEIEILRGTQRETFHLKQ